MQEKNCMLAEQKKAEKIKQKKRKLIILQREQRIKKKSSNKSSNFVLKISLVAQRISLFLWKIFSSINVYEIEKRCKNVIKTNSRQWWTTSKEVLVTAQYFAT